MPDDPTDESLLRGDVEDFGVLVHRYAQRLFGYLYALLGDSSSADDLCQVVWLKIWISRANFVAGRPFEPWLFRIASNAFIDYIRARGTPGGRRWPQSLDAPIASALDGDEAATLGETLAAPTLSPLDPAQLAELWNAIDHCIARQNPKMARTLRLRLFEGMTFVQIGEALETEYQTVYAWWGRGLKALCKSLRERGQSI